MRWQYILAYLAHSIFVAVRHEKYQIKSAYLVVNAIKLIKIDKPCLTACVCMLRCETTTHFPPFFFFNHTNFLSTFFVFTIKHHVTNTNTLNSSSEIPIPLPLVIHPFGPLSRFFIHTCATYCR